MTRCPCGARECVRLLQNELFGRKTEKFAKEDRHQLLFFNEVETTEAAEVIIGDGERRKRYILPK